MIKRQNDRLFRLLAVGVALLLIIAGILVFSDCGGDDEWVAGSGTSDNADGSAASLNGAFAAPAFRDGRYRMVSSVVNAEDYNDGAGSTLYGYSSTTRYEYLLDITAFADGIKCVYTFDRIVGSSDDNGTGAGDTELDTADKDAYTEELSPFYDLIGRSFTVQTDADCGSVSISGIDELLAAVPGANGLIDEETMLSMARDLFYPLPQTFTDGTSWTVNSYGIDNEYSVKRLERGRFNVQISGGESALPPPTTDANGYVTEYTSCAPLTGTLMLDQSDRAVQELSTFQRYSGSISDSEGYGYFFTVTASTNCTIVPEG